MGSKHTLNLYLDCVEGKTSQAPYIQHARVNVYVYFNLKCFFKLTWLISGFKYVITVNTDCTSLKTLFIVANSKKIYLFILLTERVMYLCNLLIVYLSNKRVNKKELSGNCLQYPTSAYCNVSITFDACY